MRWAAGGVAEFHETRLEARFHQTGGLVRFRSLDDPDNARGFTADTVIIDEAAKVPEAAWYEILRPMLMTTHGRALVNGTPNGRNWFWRECIRAQDGAATESAAWIEVPTLGATIEDGALIRRRHPMEHPRSPWTELVNIDATGLGDPIYDDLRAAGLRIHPYQFTASTKEQLINHAVLLVEQQQIHYPAIPQLLSELKALEYSRSPSGGLRMAAPEGMHDDAAMAFCLRSEEHTSELQS